VNRRFNLLPARYAERVAERRAAGVVGAGLLTLVALLTVASLVQSRQLARAERTRDVERARTAELQARRAALTPFRELANGIVGRERLLSAAMETQVSWATVLTSLSTTFPAGSSLTSLTTESELPPFGAVPAVTPGVEGRVIGSATLKGYSVESFNPGVEQLLRLLAGVTGLSEPRLQVGAVEEIGERPVTNFEGGAFVDATALTGRYAGGLPPESDVEVPRIGGEPARATPAAGAARASR